MTQTNESIVNIIEFIKRDDFMKIIQNMDENALSLIACAFTFTHNNLITKINGLTDDLVLPFFAIAFKYINVCKCQMFYMTNEMLNQLKLAFKNSTNNDSELQNVSIDSILSNINHFCNNKFIPNDASFYIIDILISYLLNGSYNADKSILISIICKLSCNDDENCQIQTLAIIDKYGKKLLEYIFKEFKNLNIEKISECNLNLLCFGTVSIKNLYLNIIQNSKSEKIVVNAIDFIEDHCNFTPNIKVQNKQNLIGVFNSLIDNEKWDDALLVSNFI